MKRVLCYGDSNTNGCKPEWTPQWDGDLSKCMRFDEETRWTGILQKLLGAEYRIIEEGLPGRTTVYADPVDPYLDGRLTAVPTMLSHSPIDLLVIMLGTNDVKVSFTPSEASLGSAMEALLKEIMNPYIWEHRQVPKILLVAPPWISDEIEASQFFGMYDRKSVELSKKLGEIYRRVGESYGCYFLDAAEYVKTSPVDCLHMDSENHRKLAEVLSEEIHKILK